jgi:hypothetical protein
MCEKRFFFVKISLRLILMRGGRDGTSQAATRKFQWGFGGEGPRGYEGRGRFLEEEIGAG